MLAADVAVNAGRRRWHALSLNPQLPLWVRVCALAETLSVEGHAPMTAGEFRKRLDPSGTIPLSSLSRGIKDAVRSGWLDPRSSARCLVLPEAGPRCQAIHRDGS